MLVTTAAALAFMGSICGAKNKAPSVPSITGPSSGIVGVAVTFKATTTDPEGDSVAFQFDWGDGSTPAWTAFSASGETASVTHTYADTGVSYVRCRAHDSLNQETDWCAPQPVVLASFTVPVLDSLRGEVDVSDGASEAVVSPDGRFLYVAHQGTDFITPIRLSDRSVMPVVHVGTNPWDLRVRSDGNALYVSCQSSGHVAVVSIPDHQVLATVAVGNRPMGLALTPDGNRAYVAVADDRRLVVIRTSDNSVIDSVELGDRPYDVEVRPDGSTVYASMTQALAVVSVASGAVIDTVNISAAPAWLAVSPDGRLLYATNSADSGIAVIRLEDNAKVGRISVGDPYPNDVVASPDPALVYLAHYRGISCGDVRSYCMLQTLDFGAESRLALNPAGDTLYVSDYRRILVVGPK